MSSFPSLFSTQYRSLIKSSQPIYLISSKSEKTAISRSIVATIRKANGRFLERSKDLLSYYDIGDAKATEKTSQALREGQPKLRKRMIDNGILTNDSIHSYSTEHLLMPTAAINQVNPNPVFVGDDSYTSVNRNDISASNINQQCSILEQSINQACANIKPTPILDDRLTIGNCQFRPTPNCPFGQSKHRIVTPPCTPPNPPQQLVEKAKFDNDLFACPFPSMDMDPTEFDDSNSIMTFDMDDEEMIDDQTDVQPMFQGSTPSSHFRTLTELKHNVQTYNGCERKMLSIVPQNNASPILNHFRALTELKDQVPMYPSSGANNDCQNLRFNNSNQFNGNASQNNLNASCSSIGFVPNQTLKMQVNF